MHQDVIAVATRDLRRISTFCLIAIGLSLTILILVPFSPTYPAAGLDPSWRYALNTAVANHLRFGKDIIFTFGPLASVYTRLYSPQTDMLMMFASLVIVSALLSGLLLVANAARRPWLILFPLAISQFVLLDSIFITLPVLMVYTCESGREQHRGKSTVAFLLAAACGLLVLIKGSTTLPVVFCTFLSALALWQVSRHDAIALAAIAIGSMMLAWVYSGQALSGLPAYFTSQELIISGYSNGMSVNGRLIEPFVYVLIMGLLIRITLLPSAATTWRIALALTVALFICFKAGFTRHDGHAIIAGTALFLIGYLTFLRNNTSSATLALALGLFGWLFIAGRDVDWHPSAILDRTVGQLSRSAIAIGYRIANPGLFEKQFNEAVTSIRRTHTLPAYSGTTDLYPADLSALIASGSNWSPRPVFQSYTAYTPALLSLNREHLIKSPPSRIYFNVAPIDGRYPSLEDDLSWPLLLSDYEPVAFDGDYAVLQRRDLPKPIGINEPILAGTRMLGTQVEIPDHTGPIWAEIDVKPTLLGRLVSAAYKNPLLMIILKYDDGSTRTYRFIAGLGKAGFLLSPTVQSGRDFVALQSTRFNAIFADKFPVGFEISGHSGTRFLWSKSFSIKLYTMSLAADPRVDGILSR